MENSKMQKVVEAAKVFREAEDYVDQVGFHEVGDALYNRWKARSDLYAALDDL